MFINAIVKRFSFGNRSTQPAGDNRVEWNIASITELFVLHIAFHEELIKQPKVPIHCDSRYYLYEIFMPYVFKMIIAIH